MASATEWIKGSAVFLILTLIVYFAYNNIIVGILDWVTSVNAILGAIGWVGFIALYIVSCPLYLYYTIIVGSKEGETKPMWILAGFSAFFLFLILATVIQMIMGGVGGADGLIDALSSTTETISGEDFSTLDQISFLAVLVTILGCIGAPFGLILKGYGKL